jgi:hypothetical protein
MSAKDDGGAAFPRSDSGYSQTHDGMTLRDYFAAHAMTAVGRTYFGSEDNPAADQLGNPTFAEEARRCYAWADAMLAERAK